MVVATAGYASRMRRRSDVGGAPWEMTASRWSRYRKPGVSPNPPGRPPGTRVEAPAPAPIYAVPVFTWAGFYVGLNAGAGFASNNNGSNTFALPAGSVVAVDRAVRNLLRTLFAYRFFDRAAYVDDESRIDRTAHAQEARRLAEAGTGLLQNVGRALPLDPKRLKSLAVIGAAVGGLAGAIWADSNNDGRVDGYMYNGQYYQGAPAQSTAPAPTYSAPANSGERG